MRNIYSNIAYTMTSEQLGDLVKYVFEFGGSIAEPYRPAADAPVGIEDVFRTVARKHAAISGLSVVEYEARSGDRI